MKKKCKTLGACVNTVTVYVLYTENVKYSYLVHVKESVRSSSWRETTAVCLTNSMDIAAAAQA